MIAPLFKYTTLEDLKKKNRKEKEAATYTESQPEGLLQAEMGKFQLYSCTYNYILIAKDPSPRYQTGY